MTLKTAAVDPVAVEIIRQRLMSITDQIEANLTRTAHSPLIYEYKDYCVGLLDDQGRMICQSRGSIPIFLADLGGPIREGLAVYGRAGLEPGDMVITNSVEVQGQHLNNVNMFTPVFAGTELSGFVAIRAHWSDIGGRSVGSAKSHDTTDIFQEGIQFPCLKLQRRGEPVPEIYRIIRYNTRFPEAVIGDMNAQIAGCLKGKQLFTEILDQYGLTTVQGAIETVWAQSEGLARSAVRAIADGTYSASSFLDNDGVGDAPIPINVTVRVTGDAMTIDFSEMSEQVRGPFNSGRSGGGLTAAKVAFKYLTAPLDPANEGSFRNLEVVLPEGTLLSARPGAAMARYSTPLPTVVDCVIQALATAMPDQVAAEHHASMGSYMFVGNHPQTGQLWKHQDTAHGGWGAHRGGDGSGPFKTLAHGDSLDIPVEIQEALYPVHVAEYSIRPDSGGAGQWRGGFGLNRRYVVQSPCRLTAVFERNGCPPRGLFGGEPADPGSIALKRKDHEPVQILKVTAIAVSAGDEVWIRSGGGGGYGNPLDRPTEQVCDDVRLGYVSRAGAQRDYGVVLGERGEADDAATARARMAMRRARNGAEIRKGATHEDR